VKYVRLGTMWMLLAAVPVGCVGNERADRSEAVVRLRDAVEVKRNRVWLSDLLPVDAPSSLQKAGAAIELCAAPQPGSARVLDAEQIITRLAGQPEVLRQLAIPPRITIRYEGWPIAEATVRIAISKFLREQGLLAPGLLAPGKQGDLPDAARLEWLRPLAATEEHPMLQVAGVDWDNRQQSLQLRLRCSKRAACGNFLVHVVLPAPVEEEWHRRLKPGTGLNSAQSGQGLQPGTALAEKGKPAMLVLDDGSMRISVRVICLQSGVLNQQIRVFNAQNRQVLRAEVVGAGLLHASL
jgi:hypothetical protein